MRASGYDRAAHDFYVEPAWAVDRLLSVERPFQGTVLDPCAGSGNIPMRCAAAGVTCLGSDIVDRGCILPEGPCDFFRQNPRYWAGVRSVISNPPYDRAQDFVVCASNIAADRVCVLLRLAFLEGQARKEWHQTQPLARVWVSSRRMSMPPGGTDVKAAGGTVAYAWFVYEHGHRGPPALGWF